MGLGGIIVAALIIGVLGGFIGAGALKGQMTSVHMQRSAANYVAGNGLQLTEKKDRFLYKKLEKKEKPQDQTQSQAQS